MRARENQKRPLAIIMIVVISLLLARFVFFASAATGSFALSRSAASVTTGENIVITLNASTDVPATIVQARVTYNSALLTYTGADYGGSPFNTDEPSASSGNGYVFVSRFRSTTPFPNGTNVVAKLSFKATATGNATFGISQGESAIYSANDASNVLSAVSGTSVSIQAPPSPQQPTPSTPAPSTPQQPSTSSGAGANGGASRPSNGNKQSVSADAVPSNDSAAPISNDPAGTAAPDILQQTGDTSVQAQPGNLKESTRMPSFGFRVIAPIILGGIAVAAAAWLGFKRWRQRPFGYAGGEVVSNSEIRVFDASRPTNGSTAASALAQNPVEPSPTQPNQQNNPTLPSQK